MLVTAKQITDDPSGREMDMLLSTGEQVSVLIRWQLFARREAQLKRRSVFARQLIRRPAFNRSRPSG